MTNADVNIAALRTGYDRLAAVVLPLSDEDLDRPSGAAEWDISQVVSHLGSAAEIARATVEAALNGQPGPGRDFNTTVWDRWNAMSGRARVDGFEHWNTALTELYESMDADTRENLRIDLGFMPAPVDVATATRMRLSELTLHSWDIYIGFDDDATLAPEAVGPLLAGTGDLIGWIGKSDQLHGRSMVVEVTTTTPESVFTLQLADRIGVDWDVPAQPDGTLTLPAEAWLRLVAGRLAPERTPSGVTATGTADLDLLRRIFPGY